MEEELVVVAKFDNSTDAHLAQMKLDDSGIESVLMGEDTKNMLPFGQITYIELAVKGGQAEEALRILNSEG